MSVSGSLMKYYIDQCLFYQDAVYISVDGLGCKFSFQLLWRKVMRKQVQTCGLLDAKNVFYI